MKSIRSRGLSLFCRICHGSGTFITQAGRETFIETHIRCALPRGDGRDARRLPSTEERFRIWKRDGGKCHYCGQQLSKKDFTVDHVIPWTRGGRTEVFNLVTSCRACNAKKRDSDPDHEDILKSSRGGQDSGL